MAFAKRILVLLFLVLVTSCGNTMDDLRPSGNDQRPLVLPTTSTALDRLRLISPFLILWGQL